MLCCTEFGTYELITTVLTHKQFNVFFSIELSDALWGEIWAFRQPYEKKVDLRFALEIYDEFVQKYGPLE